MTQLIASSNWAAKFNSDKNLITVEGNIIDKTTRESLTGVAVYINNELQVYTDFDGNFIISDITPGKYNLSTSLISYEDMQQEVAINNSDKLEIKLSTVN